MSRQTENRTTPGGPAAGRGRGLLASVRVVSGWTLASRLLGYGRDLAMAALLGGSSWQLDTFLTAFPIPNLFRRVFGEGALASAFVPLFSEAREREGEEEAWRFAGRVFSLLVVVLGSAAAGGEVLFWVLRRWAGDGERSALLLRLLLVLFPYLVPICLGALLAGVLQVLGRFGWSASAPIVLNLCWLGALGLLWWWGPASAAQTQVMVLAAAVLLSGLLQVAVLYQGVRRCGGRLRWSWAPAEPRLRRMLRLMLPTALAGAVFQLNVLADRFIALWGVAEPGGVFALYLGMRLVQFPLALIGIATGTVALAALSEYAGRGDEEGYRRTLASALSGVLAVAVPASVGLMVLAGPAVRLLFQWRAFGPRAAERAAAVLVLYGVGLWAYCLQHVLTRAYYARQDMRSPVRVGLPMVGVNLALNLALVGPMAERGLALATAVTAVLQTALLGWGLRGWLKGRGRRLVSVAVRAAAASALMGVSVLAVRWLMPTADGPGSRLALVGVPLTVGVGVYLLGARGLRLSEVFELLGGRSPKVP